MNRIRVVATALVLLLVASACGTDKGKANNPAKAEEHLAALQRICLIPCEEYADLKKAIADYRARAAK